jgi:hypothetical protein
VAQGSDVQSVQEYRAERAGNWLIDNIVTYTVGGSAQPCDVDP